MRNLAAKLIVIAFVVAATGCWKKKPQDEYHYLAADCACRVDGAPSSAMVYFKAKPDTYGQATTIEVDSTQCSIVSACDHGSYWAPGKFRLTVQSSSAWSHPTGWYRAIGQRSALVAAPQPHGTKEAAEEMVSVCWATCDHGDATWCPAFPSGQDTFDDMSAFLDRIKNAQGRARTEGDVSIPASEVQTIFGVASDACERGPVIVGSDGVRNASSDTVSDCAIPFATARRDDGPVLSGNFVVGPEVESQLVESSDVDARFTVPLKRPRIEAKPPNGNAFSGDLAGLRRTRTSAGTTVLTYATDQQGCFMIYRGDK